MSTVETLYLVTQVIVLGAVLYHTYPQGTESVIIPQTSDISVYPPFMLPSLGYHVTVADGGHGDEGPPQAQGNGRKVVVGIGLKMEKSESECNFGRENTILGYSGKHIL